MSTGTSSSTTLLSLINQHKEEQKMKYRINRAAIFLFVPLHLWARSRKKQTVVTKSIQAVWHKL